MTLDDVIRGGKKINKVEALLGDPKSNVAVELAKINGVDRSDRFGFSLLEEESPDYTRPRQEKIGTDYLNSIGPGIVGHVQANINVSVRAITNEGVLRAYVLSRKPVKYEGVDNDTFKVHKEAYEARELLSDKDKLAEKAGEFVDKALEKITRGGADVVIVRLMQNIYAKTGKALEVIQSEALAKLQAFEDRFTPNIARDYALGRYQALADPQKAQEAYEIAKAVGKSN